VRIEDGHGVVESSDSHRAFELQELPSRLVEWQLESKLKVYDAIERDEYIAFDPGHLPVVGTWDAALTAPNLANKGVGFTPRDEHLERYRGILESAVARIRELPLDAVDETRAIRLAAAREFYTHPEHIDWRRLALLEIFEGTTYRNVTASPFAAVLWTGGSPSYISFQVDCLVEVMTSDDPRYRFAWAMRRLFEHEPFHVVQTVFPFAYCFWVVGARDKTPKRRHHGPPPRQREGKSKGADAVGIAAQALARGEEKDYRRVLSLLASSELGLDELAAALDRSLAALTGELEGRELELARSELRRRHKGLVQMWRATDG
jgi:hypothetical protein